tara:strand:- start:2846 stop:4633 length:1788 start_codon:yes stop_codon:yes gene_type:complete
MADEIKIELVADANGVIKAVEKVVPAAQDAGKKAAKGIETPLKKTGDAIAKSFAAIGAVIATAMGGKKFIEAAALQDAAVQKLNASLRNMGVFSQETSQSLQNFASSLQAQSVIGDEVVLDQLAFAQAMGASVEQSKQILSAAADMSSALGIDLNSAVRNISKTLGGYAGELGEVIPELKGLSAEQLKAGQGIDLLAGKFQGFATAETKTFTGAMTQLQKTLGDAAEKIGEAVVKSPVLIKAINLISTAINNTFGKFPVSALIKDLDGFILTLADVADSLSFLVQPIVTIGRIFSMTFTGAKAAFQGLIVGITQGLLKTAETLPSIFGKILPVEELKIAASSASEVMDGFVAESQTKFDTLLEHDTSFSDSIRERISNFSSSLQETLALTNESLEVQGENGDKAKNKITTIYDGLIKKQEDFAKQAKISLVQNAAGAFSQGFSAMGAAVANGANAFEAGMNAILGSFGGALAQLGQGYMLQGLAMIFAGQPGGGALVGQGAVLSVFGGFLSAKFGGGASGAPSAAGSAGGISTTDPLTGATPVDIVDDEPEEVERQQQVQLVVQGDILDSEETGTRLLNILNEEFDQKGGRIAYA